MNMKIAYLSTFYPFRGGIAQFNAALYRQLEKSHEIRAYTFTRQYPNIFFPGATQFVTKDDPADPVPAQRILDTINPLTFWKTRSVIRQFAPDILLTKFWMPFFAPSLGFVSGGLGRSNVKTVAILDNVIPHETRPGDIRLIRYFLNSVDGFIAMSRTVQNDLLALKPEAHFKLKPHPIYDHFGATVPPQKARELLGLPDDKKIILFFGFIRDYKGLDMLIRAIAHLSGDFLLVIAGEVYGDFAKYQALIDETKTRNKIKLFVHYIDDHEVCAFFSAADVCVLPYKSATQSGIVQIAYNFDLPVIVTDVGGLAEMVEDGCTGLVVAGPDPALIAESIRRYFDRNFKEHFSANIARKREHYSWAGFAGTVEMLYKEICQ